jgi:putative SOS response-associated peptidase YedK
MVPVSLERDQFESWLTGRVGLEILRPAPGDVLLKHPISKRVNSSRTSDEDETLISQV